MSLPQTGRQWPDAGLGKRGVYHARGWKSGDREISEAEYRQHQVRALRGFSGHWLLFFALPALFFLHLKPVDLFEPEPQPVKKRSRATARGRKDAPPGNK